MAVDVFSGTVHHNIGSQLQRLLQTRAHEGVVNNDGKLMQLAGLGNLLDIKDRQLRVGGCFDIDSFRIGLNRLEHCRSIRTIDKVALDTEPRCEGSQEVIRAAVHILCYQDMISILQEAKQGNGDGGHSAGNTQGIFAAFQCRDLLLQCAGGRISVSAVIHAFCFTCHHGGCRFRIRKRIGNRRDNALGNGARPGIGRLALMNNLCVHLPF
ncbi:hypothetical protein D3C75_704480 [compost metagenome]